MVSICGMEIHPLGRSEHRNGALNQSQMWSLHKAIVGGLSRGLDTVRALHHSTGHTDESRRVSTATMGQCNANAQ